MRKIFCFFGLIILSMQVLAQLPLKGDTVIYTKTGKNLKELLPAGLNFLNDKSKIKDIKAVYKNSKLTKINNEKGFSLVFEDKINDKIKYIAAGNLSDENIEVVRISFDAKLLNTILPNIGPKTITDKGADYWFFLTKDNFKVFFILNKMGNSYAISIGIRPKTWEHLAKK